MDLRLVQVLRLLRLFVANEDPQCVVYVEVGDGRIGVDVAFLKN
jgi:hypothetical protein